MAKTLEEALVPPSGAAGRASSARETLKAEIRIWWTLGLFVVCYIIRQGDQEDGTPPSLRQGPSTDLTID